MNHDHHVSTSSQGFAIAGLLIASVTVVAVVKEDLQAEAPGKFNRLIAAAIVDQDANIDEFGQFFYSRYEGFLRVVGGHNDRNTFAVNHGRAQCKFTGNGKRPNVPLVTGARFAPRTTGDNTDKLLPHVVEDRADDPSHHSAFYCLS